MAYNSLLPLFSLILIVIEILLIIYFTNVNKHYIMALPFDCHTCNYHRKVSLPLQSMSFISNLQNVQNMVVKYQL